MKFDFPFYPQSFQSSGDRIFFSKLAAQRAQCVRWNESGHHASRLVMTIFLMMFFGMMICQAGELPKQEEKKGTKVEASAVPDNVQLPVEKGKTDEEMNQLGDLILKAVEAENEKKYAEAANYYTKALKIDEESAVALLRRGMCYMKLNRNKEAADDIWSGLHQKPKTVSDFASIAWVRATSPLERFRDGSVAVAYGLRALKENESADYYDVLAAGYAEMGNFQKARDTIEKGIKYFSDSPRVADMRKRLDLYKEKKKYREDWGLKEEE